MAVDLTKKAETLANKMNALTEKFGLADEMIIEGNDIIQAVEEKTKKITLYKENEFSEEMNFESFNSELVLEIVNLNNMVEDFQYVRESLKETTDNGRTVLNSITSDLIDSDEEGRADLILSFAQLNSAVGNNMKLYMESYKNMSVILGNIDKILKQTKNNDTITPSVVNNTQINVNSTEQISTADLLMKLRANKEK